ncbi:hypothetical protein EV195_103216 [Tenacibaculum skagerrakense]|uniref:Secreted protein n=1 Tax=Tenacibaculum skagerrakense TaxID=186571 RepID=A0A4R2NW86_9FLAO|nr:hypothetical protein [Tenacibaculum skagerrakense]TCP25854.1 hypothetical protein EV195_103216 [Tenacibaculum skagerrakense]
MKKIKSILVIVALAVFTFVGCKNETKDVNKETTNETKQVETEQQKNNVVEVQENETTITVKAGSALEYKFKINSGENLTYKWSSTAPLIFDFHGDPEEKDKFPEGYFKSYSKGTSAGEQGTETMPFKGSHGWYWKNSSDSDVKVTLSTKGNYIIIGKIQ